jgi:hypothetical protein
MDNGQMINSLIDKVISGDTSGASDDFKAVISAKAAEALDARKVELAQSLYTNNQAEKEDESQ